MEKKKILLADDEPDIVLILKRYLEHDGYEVTTCSTGREALDAVNAAKFDLIILDVMMPGMNGWEACKVIKKTPELKNTPVIILTARSESIDTLMSFECGADEYASKPFEYPVLSETIRTLLAGRANAASPNP